MDAECALRDGLAEGYSVRLLGPTDLEAYLAHLSRLDGPARALRFSAGVDDHFLLSHCLSRILSSCILVGGFAQGTLRGAVEIDMDDELMEGEPGLSVEKPYRRKGLGGAMLRLAIAEARAAGAGALRFDVERGNTAMIKLVEGCGATPVGKGNTRTYRLILNARPVATTVPRPSFFARLLARPARVA